MDLPLRAMQTAFVRRCGPSEGPWHRSRIVDFTVDLEVVLLLPDLAALAGPPPAGPDSALAPGDHDLTMAGDEEDAPAAELIYTPGTEIEIEIAFPNGLRRFTTAVRRLDFAFGGSMRVRWPTGVRRVQRRNHVRVETRLAASVVPASPAGSDEDAEVLAGHTLDISVGGVRVRLPSGLEPESRVTIRVAGTPFDREPLTARVVRSLGPLASGSRTALPGPPEGDFQVSFEFIEVDAAVRKELTRFIFELQRELKRRSVG